MNGMNRSGGGAGGYCPDEDPLNKPHVPLTQVRVLYIGRAAPKATLDSIEAVQKPLCELFTKDDQRSRETDIDAVLTVFTSGLLMQPVNPLDPEVWLRIQDLQSCAAVRATVEVVPGAFCGDEAGRLSFVPVGGGKGSGGVGGGGGYPPIFAALMGRSNGLPLIDCYAFVCPGDDCALQLVNAAMQAFGNRRGWAGDRPPMRTLQTAQSCNEVDLEVVLCQDDQTPPDFYEKPPLQGFFYAPRADLIQRYKITGDSVSTSTSVAEGSANCRGQLYSPYCPPPPAPECPPPPPPPCPSPAPVPVMFYDNEQDFLIVDGNGVPQPLPPGFAQNFQNGGDAMTTMMMMMNNNNNGQQQQQQQMMAFPPQMGQGSSGAMAFNPYLVPNGEPMQQQQQQCPFPPGPSVCPPPPQPEKKKKKKKKHHHRRHDDSDEDEECDVVPVTVATVAQCNNNNVCVNGSNNNWDEQQQQMQQQQRQMMIQQQLQQQQQQLQQQQQPLQQQQQPDPIYQRRLPPALQCGIMADDFYNPLSGPPPAPNPPPPAEETYAKRLPPPTGGPAPAPPAGGAMQFDSNFILRQSDTDKARIVDGANLFPVPMNPYQFGY